MGKQLSALLLLLFVVSMGSAGIVAYAPLPVIERQSAAVLVAEIESIVSGPTLSSVVVRVLRTVKGVERSPGVVETLRIEGEVLDASATTSYGPRLWFIRSDGTVIPRISNVPGIDGLTLPAVPEDRYQQVASESASLRLGSEVAAAAREGILDAPSLRQVSHYFQSKPSAERKQLEELAFPPVHGKILDVATLLSRSDPVGVDSVVNQIATKLPDGRVRDALCAYRSPSPAGIAALAKILESATDVGLVVCALVALKEIHTSDTIPVLAKSLDRSDPHQRYLAVSGLYFAANTGKLPMERPLVVDGEAIQRPMKSAESIVGELPPFDVY